MKKRWKIIGLIVLIVVVVLGVSSPFVYRYCQRQMALAIKEAVIPFMTTLAPLASAIEMYKSIEGKEPTSLEQLVPEYFAEVPRDSYGTPYKLRKEGENYTILSAGPDKEFDTKDDTKMSFGPISKIGKEKPFKVKIGDKIQKATEAIEFRALKRKGYEIKVIFKSVAGLKEMAPVRLAGVRIGVVKKINLIQEPTVRAEVILRIKEDIKVKEDSRFDIATIGLLREKYIVIIPGSADSPVAKPGTTFIGCEPIMLSEEEQKELIRKLFLTLGKEPKK